jgi:hypothetical protein
VAGVGYVILGAAAGLLTLVVLPERILPPPRMPGLSLILAPVATGAVMHAYGRWRRARGSDPTHLATFWGGALFAFAMACPRAWKFGRPPVMSTS